MNGSLLVVVVVLVGAGEFVKLVQCRLDSGVEGVSGDGFCCIGMVVVLCLDGKVHVHSVVCWVE